MYEGTNILKELHDTHLRSKIYKVLSEDLATNTFSKTTKDRLANKISLVVRDHMIQVLSV
jgi:hypothetical protein